MPCYTPPPTTEMINAHGYMTLGQFEAVLCGIFTAIEGDSTDVSDCLDDLDWSEIGVDRNILEKWWENHKAKDEQHKEVINI